MVKYFVGSGECDFDIVGESHYQDNIQSILDSEDATYPGAWRFSGEDRHYPGALSFDDGNKHDPSAVAVFILPALPGNGVLVGYLDRAKARAFRAETALIDLKPKELMLCRSKIVGGWDNGKGDTGKYGVKLDLAFPLVWSRDFEDSILVRTD